MRHVTAARTAPTKPNDSRGFLHKRIGGAVRGFVTGGITGAARGFVTSGRATRPTSQIRTSLQGQRVTTTSGRLGPFGVFGSFERTERARGFTVPAGTGRAVAEIAIAGLDRQARGPVIPTADGCPKGFHLNKSAYNLKDGARIEERTLCVRNRRRNNDNGAASLRAARRLIGRKKQQDKIDEALKGIIKPARRRSSPKQIAAPGIIVAGN